MKSFKSVSNYVIVATLLLGVFAFAIAGCGPAVDVSGKEGESIASLTEESLKNAEYQGIYADPIRLTGGKYEGEPFVEGGASRPTVIFTNVYAFGDLDGDGVDDAVVVLVENSGGSGSFVYLAAVLNRNGSLENVATQFLGDRGQVESLSIAEGEITVNLATHGPDDPMCCPSQQEVQVYVLRGNDLVQLSSQSDAASDLDITGITWQWWGLVETEPAAQSVVPNSENYTLVLQSDGSLHIKADCNVVGGTYTLEGDALTIELGPSTMAFCGEASLDQQFLEWLGNAGGYVLKGDQLILKASAGDMIFARAGM
jgi:heat shock protein HslJ